MRRRLRCILGFHRYEWWTVRRDAGGGYIALDTYGRRTCCDQRIILVDVSYVPFPPSLRR